MPERCSHEVGSLRESASAARRFAQGEPPGSSASSAQRGARDTSSRLPPRLYATALTASIVQTRERPLDKRQRIAAFDVAGFQHAKIPAGAAALHDELRHIEAIPAAAELPARRARLRDLHDRCADLGRCRRSRPAFRSVPRPRNFLRTIPGRTRRPQLAGARTDSDRRNTRRPPCRDRHER